MKLLNKIKRIFSLMPMREKILAIVLITIFAVYLSTFIIKIIHFPLRETKDVFSEGIVGQIKTLNPLFADINETDRDISQLIFSGLIRYDPLQKNFFPDLASAWNRSRDGLNYTFTLRENALWHDLAPVTADDVVFTFKEIIQNPGFRNPMLKNTFEGVNIVKTSNNIVAFTLPKPNSYFISNLTVGILPKHLLDSAIVSNLERDPFNRNPIGTGPYKIKSVKLGGDGDIADLDIFPQYYREKPKIQRIRIYTFPTMDKALKDINALHGIARLHGDAAKSIEANPRFSLYNYILNQFTALYFNTDNNFLKEKNVRKALAQGLDKNSLIGESEQRTDTIDLMARQNDKAFGFNLEAAKKTLDDAGFLIGTGTDGIRTNDKGEKLKFDLLVYSKLPESLSDEIKEQWNDLGIDIRVIRADKDFYDKVIERKYDMLLLRQNLGYNRDVYPLFHSSQVGGQGLNFSNFRSFRTDGITEAIRKEKTPADKEKLLQELSKAISDETPVIFISTPVYFYALDKHLEPFPSQSLDYHSDRFSITPYLGNI